jgi:hypothetical protein
MRSEAMMGRHSDQEQRFPVRSDRAARPVLAASFLIPQLAGFLIFVAPVSIGLTHWWSYFRNYYYTDQLAYAGIATDAQNGGVSLVEPFTQTGHSYYPSAYYISLGMVARIFHVTVASAWTGVGLAVIGICILTAGLGAWLVTRASWAPLLACFPITMGTLSSWTSDNWFTSLKSHAVLWGPYGDMFSLNSQFAGLALCILGASGLIYLLHHPPRHQFRLYSSVAVCCALIGFSANIHAYAFLLSVAVLALSTSVYGCLRATSRLPLYGTMLLLAAVFLLGNRVAEATSHLVVFGFLLIAMVPGLLVVASRWRWTAISGMVGSFAAALPQLVLEATGTLRHDEFLEYRQNSSSQVTLGVDALPGLVAALPFLLVASFVLTVAVRRRSVEAIAVVTGSVVGSALMATNDKWGFNQEPYRFWLAGLILSSFLLVPHLAWAINEVTFSGGASWRRERMLLAFSFVVYVLALSDVLLFWTSVRTSGALNLQDQRYVAMQRVSTPTDGLLANGPCVEPTVLKVLTGKRVAFFHRGIAWPEHRQDIEHVMDLVSRGIYDPEALRASRVKYLITDSACQTAWDVKSTQGVRLVASASYQTASATGTFSLWKL